MKSFDEWFDKEYSNYGNSYKKTYDEKHDIYGSQFVDERYDAYKAGQQSKQAEVDEFRKRIDEALDCLNNLSWASEIDVGNVSKVLKGDQS